MGKKQKMLGEPSWLSDTMEAVLNVREPCKKTKVGVIFGVPSHFDLRKGLRRGEGGMGHAEAPSDTNNQKYGLKATKKYQKMEVHHLVGGWATPLKNIRQLG